MSEFKGSKGKWINKENPISVNQMYVTAKHSIICRLNNSDFDSDEEMDYNALLISKAPEMLEMLKRCEYWISACNENANILKDISELIKEATEL